MRRTIHDMGLVNFQFDNPRSSARLELMDVRFSARTLSVPSFGGNENDNPDPAARPNITGLTQILVF
jgi:hypothetical protein